jgi:Glycosyl transferase family 2
VHDGDARAEGIGIGRGTAAGDDEYASALRPQRIQARRDGGPGPVGADAGDDGRADDGASLCFRPVTPVAIVVPTRGRPPALERALRSMAPQARSAGGEIVVVEDGDESARAIAERHGARFVALLAARGPNAARNAGIAATDADLVVLAEDDVEAPAGWLEALLGAAAAHPEIEVFGGPIRGRIDGRDWRTCGREWAPISSFWRGDADREVDLVFAGNMAIRRSALQRVGPFAESLGLYADEATRIARATSGAAPAAGFFGDEEEWQDRYRAGGGRILYAAGARLDHVRAGSAARTGALVRAAYGRGKVARRWSQSRGRAPSLPRELRVLAGSAWHLVARRCMNGLLFAADAAGRVREAVSRG